DLAVELLPHGVAGGVQALVADDDRVGVEAGLLRVPAAVVGAAEDAEQFGGVDAPAPRHPVLPVAGEGHVLGFERAARPDLGGLLAQQGDPDAELALALQGVALPVEPADQHHVPVQAAKRLVAELYVEIGVLDPLSFGGEELNEVSSAFTGSPQSGDHLLPAGSCCGSGRGPGHFAGFG